MYIYIYIYAKSSGPKSSGPRIDPCGTPLDTHAN